MYPLSNCVVVKIPKEFVLIQIFGYKETKTEKKKKVKNV